MVHAGLAFINDDHTKVVYIETLVVKTKLGEVTLKRI